MTRIFSVLVVGMALVAGCSAEDEPSSRPAPTPSPTRPSLTTPSPATSPVRPTPTPTPDPSHGPTTTPTATGVSLANWFDQLPSTSPLTMGAERERTADYRSYDVTYQSDGLSLTGVATATYDALVAAGVDARLAWYDQHAFGPQFDASMNDAIEFLGARLS